MTWTDAEISKYARKTKIIQNEDHGDQQDERRTEIKIDCQTCEGRGGYPRQIDDEGNCVLDKCQICEGVGQIILEC